MSDAAEITPRYVIAIAIRAVHGQHYDDDAVMWDRVHPTYGEARSVARVWGAS